MLMHLESGLVRTLDAAELRRAFGAATAGLLAEIQHADPRLASDSVHRFWS